ncbi:MAG: Bug family tripartite tricarboxylate transporter substrate binding protein, partial [Pseudomonadota bacterium]|nr:Bug family tripartite tricarboxylate transporter substrate binding protein [Pseudomonadota bacterium]
AGLGLPLSAQAQGSLELAKIICGFPPGGTSDAISRRIADKLRGNYATNVLVENKPGAGGQIAVTTVRDSAPDGSTILLTPSSMLSIYPYTYPKLPYKPMEDLQPVSLACTFNHGFGVGPAVPESVKNFKDFLAWAKANPDKANYGSPAAGSMPHMVAALASILSGVPMKHIPYRGSAPGIQDLLGGQIAAMSSPIGDYLPYIKTGKLRVLAISGINRSQFVPDVPTFRQQGLPITVREWYGLFLPGKANTQAARRAAAYAQAALSQPDLITSMAQFGMEVQSSSPQALSELMKADADEWRRLIKQVGFTAES